jgi:hypothetical protein
MAFFGLTLIQIEFEVTLGCWQLPLHNRQAAAAS